MLGENAACWTSRAPASWRVLRLGSTSPEGAWLESDGVAAAWMAGCACSAAIVRPDHYVGAVVDDPVSLQGELDIVLSRLDAVDTLKPHDMH